MEEDNSEKYVCTYCDKSFRRGNSLVRHLYTHIDGGSETQTTATDTCPISRTCKFSYLSKESLLTHILSYHPDHPSAKEFQLESNDDLSAVLTQNELKLNYLKEPATETSSQTETARTIGTSATPVCAVKPLPPTSTRLVEDLADTVSAIEAICSLNNEDKNLGLQHEFSPSISLKKQHNYSSNVMSADPSNNEKSIFENTFYLPTEYQVMLTLNNNNNFQKI